MSSDAERKARLRAGYTVYPVEVHQGTVVAMLVAEGHLEAGSVTRAEISAAMSAHFRAHSATGRILVDRATKLGESKQAQRYATGKPLVKYSGPLGWAFQGDPDYIEQHKKQLEKERRIKDRMLAIGEKVKSDPDLQEIEDRVMTSAPKRRGRDTGIINTTPSRKAIHTGVGLPNKGKRRRSQADSVKPIERM